MSPLILTIAIDKPVETVFDTLLDIPAWSAVLSQVASIEMLDGSASSGEIGVGTRFRETRNLFGRQAVEVLEITDCQRPHTLVLSTSAGDVDYRALYTLEARRKGNTSLTLTFTAEPTSTKTKVLGACLLPLMKRAMAQCIERDLKDWKQAIEAVVASKQPTPAGTKNAP